jgi:hypothetical protein
MRVPTNSARHAPLNPVVLLIGSGARVDYMRTKLRRLGGAVASAKSVSEAASLFRECSSFDAVVISAEIPESGWEIAQELRNVVECAAPVCVVSSQPPALRLRHEARAGGVQFFRRKEGLPFVLDTLVRRTLNRLLGLTTVVSELFPSDVLVSLLLEC